MVDLTTMWYLPEQYRVDVDFYGLSYTVPDGIRGSKLILRNINGQFKSRELTAILGPSGAGKSTLLNVLAGYKCRDASGEILINGKQRNIKRFRELSRYIMQEDQMQPMLTVNEAMMVAANLKLGLTITRAEKQQAILEILELLRLQNTLHTRTTSLSGGEKKRLSIALELINNPPVLFLDEPTTGLDDLSCTQCIILLKQIAQGGRTVICSIHTPSAKMFSVFDNVYIMSSGQCIYQGYGPEVVPFLSNFGLECPKHFNPADFIMEVACEEYGCFQDRLVTAIDNGRCTYSSSSKNSIKEKEEFLERISDQPIIEDDSITVDQGVSFNSQKSYWLMQYCILLIRMWRQMWRDKCYLALRVVLHILVGILIGNIYLGMGGDGSKTIFNFGFYFTCIIFFMYIPMMPVLIQFPRELQLIKREHFNKWYSLSAYFAALTTSTFPLQLCFALIYLVMVYTLTAQPMEFGRFSLFYLICVLTAITSESLGLLISSRLSLVNAVFVGPVISVPFMLLAVYGFGSGYDSIPSLIKFAMHFSYLRYSIEALIRIMLTNREKLPCPEEEEFCIWTDLDYFMKDMGMDNSILWVDITALVFIFFLFRGGSYYLLRQRLKPNKTFLALEYIGRLIKSQFGR